MQFKQYILLVALTIGFVTISFSQRRSIKISNGFAIGGGLTQFDIKTDNFETKAGNGWMISASATGDLPHKWYNISYGMQLSENKLEISGRTSNTNLAEETLEYKVFTAQIALLMHIKLVESFVTLDLGPMLQYNGKLELEDKAQELYLVNGFTNLAAEDLADISQFNLNGAVGATLGFGHFKLRAQYIYGFTNILKKLKDQDLDTTGTANGDFKGNQTMVAFTALITF
jgi:hypothetical protein